MLGIPRQGIKENNALQLILNRFLCCEFFFIGNFELIIPGVCPKFMECTQKAEFSEFPHTQLMLNCFSNFTPSFQNSLQKFNPLTCLKPASKFRTRVINFSHKNNEISIRIHPSFFNPKILMIASWVVHCMFCLWQCRNFKKSAMHRLPPVTVENFENFTFKDSLF